jgi:hypothetical protein
MDGAFIARQERVYAAVAVAAGVLDLHADTAAHRGIDDRLK